MRREHIAGRPGSERRTSRARNHNLIGEIVDHEIRSSGMPLFPEGEEFDEIVKGVLKRMNEIEPDRWQIFNLKEGARYYKMYAFSERRRIFVPVHHGIDDGKHEGKTRPEVDLGNSYSKENYMD